jgi:Skp family chaperone for outer membrane proteins
MERFVSCTKVFFLLLILLLTACVNTGRVAIIDLDKVASAIGRDKLITESVQVFAKEQETILTALRDELRNNLEKETKKIGINPSKSSKKKIAKLSENSDSKLRQEINKVKDQVARLRVSLVMEFKKEVEPVASLIAAARGMGIVMIKQNFMLSISPESDITNDVVNKL